MVRPDGRRPDQLRPVRITRDYIKYAEGSVFIEVGDTKVVCTASVEDKVPPFIKGTGGGWITAEYSMLPRATQTRNIREASKGKQGGRTFEIQRLIGRALRSVVDLSKLGERTIWIDCDVIQADGGTRTTSITGSFIALMDALIKIYRSENWTTFPVIDFLASTSVGIVDGRAVLDLSFAEDSRAQVDMNVVMTGSGKIVEIQGTAEEQPFTRAQLDQLINLAESGINRLVEVQKRLIPAAILEKIGGAKDAKAVARNEE